MNTNSKPAIINVLLWLASVASMIGIMFISGRLFKEDNFVLLIEFIVITIVTLIFLYLVSGKKTFTYLNNQTGYTVRMLLPTLIFPGFFALMSIISLIMNKPALNENWLKNIVLLTINMFLVGIYEEGCFRACACDALLPAFKKCRHPFLLTAVISSLLFGYVHVVRVDFSDLQQVIQFTLKILTVAMTGITYMILYWKTRNLLGLAIVHCLNDFLPSFMFEIFKWENITETGYTSGNSGTTIVYIVQLVFNIACLIYVYRKVGKTIDYRKTLEEW